MRKSTSKINASDSGDIAPRRLSTGRSYVYVVPCRDDTVLKIGFSRDPLQRFSSLHPRYYEFFDLDRGALVETAYVRDARRIERRFFAMLAPYSAPAPLVVPKAAAGQTEWYRGVHDDALAIARDLCISGGHELYVPLKEWLRARLNERSDLLFDWCSKALEMAKFERFNPGYGEERLRWESALRDVLDAYEAVGLPVASFVPKEVLGWYGEGDDEE